MTFRTRFAPSPTGPLHLGHAYSALLAYDMAQSQQGSFLLRIEDIDKSRARPHWETRIYDDLRWLGVSWEQPVLRQSDNMQEYQHALERLAKLGVIYPCYCSRKDILAALQAPQEGSKGAYGPDGLIYPGTCRDRPGNQPSSSAPALRLNMRQAMTVVAAKNESSFFFKEIGAGSAKTISFNPIDLINHVGDVVLARRDMGTSYHLSVVVDDALQNINHVVRGEDLFDATKIHVVLQRLLNLPTPVYCHHRLIRDAAGKRLAKRDDARAIAKYRDEGLTSHDIRAMVGLG